MATRKNLAEPSGAGWQGFDPPGESVAEFVSIRDTPNLNQSVLISLTVDPNLTRRYIYAHAVTQAGTTTNPMSFPAVIAFYYRGNKKGSVPFGQSNQVLGSTINFNAFSNSTSIPIQDSLLFYPGPIILYPLVIEALIDRIQVEMPSPQVNVLFATITLGCRSKI